MIPFSDKNYTVLNTISTPADLKKLSSNKQDLLAREIREELIDTVSKNGGHLAPNLGVVELTMALHTVFNAPKDQMVWDVGHQAYVHKLLTGRQELLQTLRQDDGCLPFLSPEESEYDSFGAGHAGTAISAALGMAAARDQQGTDENVIAVVGDGSLNCGVSLEGLNNISETTKKMVVILNDNKMSISENVGAIQRYLNTIIAGKRYNRFRRCVQAVVSKFPHSRKIKRRISKLEGATKGLFVPGALFEQLGLRYVGPIDGHDLPSLIKTLQFAKNHDKPVIVHVITEKGKGYRPAELEPKKFHGLSKFDKLTGKSCNPSMSLTFSKAFGQSLIKLADQDKRVVAITAAMCSGTGLDEFLDKYPKRFYDVGIAEEHAIVFAAGLAIRGMTPVVAIYCSFLQRAFDCVFHDVCLQNLPVIICADRAGVVDDGPTHHGIQDLGFLRTVPNLSVLMPKDENELQDMLSAAHLAQRPVLIRYPRGGSGLVDELAEDAKPIEWGKAEVVRSGPSIALWALGSEVVMANQVADLLSEYDISTTVVNTRFVAPFDSELLRKHAERMPVVTIEDHQTHGGLASVVDEVIVDSSHRGVCHFGWGKDIVPHGTRAEIRLRGGLTAEQISQKIRDTFFS